MSKDTYITGDDLSDSFKKLMAYNFPRYRGKVIERIGDCGFMVFSKGFPDWQSATKAVDEFYEKFPESINRQKIAHPGKPDNK